MHEARLTVDPEFRVGAGGPAPVRLVRRAPRPLRVRRDLRARRTPTADEHGFRRDVAELVARSRRADPPLPRRQLRLRLQLGGRRRPGRAAPDPARPGLAVDRDQRGRDWTSSSPGPAGSGIDTMLAVNLGTRGVDAARNLVEYANHPGGTYWSDLRRANGVPDPYGIRVWCLGNEMDGPWQIGHKTAAEYGRVARGGGQGHAAGRPGHRARGVRQLATTRCRRSARGRRPCSPRRTTSSTTSRCTPTTRSRTATGTASSAVPWTPTGSSRTWSRPPTTPGPWAGTASGCTSRSTSGTSGTRTGSSARRTSRFEQAPRLIEDVYSLTDAVVVGTLLNSLLRHADRVKIACLAQLVNVIAPIMTEPGRSRRGGRRPTTHSR